MFCIFSKEIKNMKTLNKESSSLHTYQIMFLPERKCKFVRISGDPSAYDIKYKVTNQDDDNSSEKCNNSDMFRFRQP